MGFSEGLADAVAAAANSVVRVQGRPGRIGSGTVWADDVVVTVARAVRGDEADIGLPDGSVVRGKVVGREPLADLAVIRVDVKLTPFRRGDPSALRVGNLVIPLGRPGGPLRAALGLVAGLGEEGVAPGVVLAPRIDVDGSLPAGFPGGPLVDDTGALLGVNTRGLLPGGTTVPIGTLAPIVERLLAHGTRRRGWLGVATHEVALAQAQAASAGQARALAIIGVDAAGPASAAGLVVGDLLVGLDGPVDGAERLLERLVEKGAGAVVTARLLRGTDVRELSVTLGEAPRRRCG